ncbi:collagen-like domain-containing protein, partial [Sphingobacterium faecale]
MNIKNFALTGLLFSSVVVANAQQKLSDGTGDNGLTVSQNAILELVSKNKGLLHTKVALESTSKAAPMSTHVAGLMVYNTETRNDVVPGVYYNDGTKWILASGGKATSISYNPATYEISFVDVTGAPVTIDFKEVVKKNETITTLIDNGDGTITYKDEVGRETIIDLKRGPKGESGKDGADGKSAYDIAVDGGFKGSESDWLLSLVGARGADGKSALEIWQELPGNDGKDGADFIASITGKNGIDGVSPEIGS